MLILTSLRLTFMTTMKSVPSTFSAVAAVRGEQHAAYISKGHISQTQQSRNYSSSEVAQFFADRSVLVTGSTGFLGKVLVEKLLRSCPDIRNLYLLIRPKAGKDSNARLEEITNVKLFDRIRQECPSVIDKLRVINGDITEPELGISYTDLEMLSDEVSVVFHSAATVKFDEPMEIAVAQNLSGAKHALQACKRLKQLSALVHVSTAYSNSDIRDVNEMIYRAPVEPNKLIDLASWMDVDVLNSFTPRLLGKWPNTYTYTKVLAEYLIKEEGKGMPICIVRPSVIASSAKDPVPGWIDNLNASTGVLLPVGTGMLRLMPADDNITIDIIPVDYVANCMIAAAWNTATSNSRDIAVYNCVTGNDTPLPMKQLLTTCSKHFYDNPLNDCLFYPALARTTSKFVFKWGHRILHELPCQILDTTGKLFGKKPRLMKVQKKLLAAQTTVTFFMQSHFNFETSNTVGLVNKLSPTDRQIFEFDPRIIDWKQYLHDYFEGMRVFLMKQDRSQIEKNRAKIRRKKWLARAIVAGAVLFIYNETSKWVPYLPGLSSLKESSMALVTKYYNQKNDAETLGAGAGDSPANEDASTSEEQPAETSA